MIENREHSDIELGSNRSFGFVFAVVFGLIGLYPLINDAAPRWWALGCAGVMLLITLVKPNLLAPLNRLWFKFGMLLAKIINPIVMFLIYVTTMVPIGLLLRLSGKDLLSLKLDSDENSYWIERAPPGPEPDSLTEQF